MYFICGFILNMSSVSLTLSCFFWFIWCKIFLACEVGQTVLKSQQSQHLIHLIKRWATDYIQSSILWMWVSRGWHAMFAAGFYFRQLVCWVPKMHGVGLKFAADTWTYVVHDLCCCPECACVHACMRVCIISPANHPTQERFTSPWDDRTWIIIKQLTCTILSWSNVPYIQIIYFGSTKNRAHSRF